MCRDPTVRHGFFSFIIKNEGLGPLYLHKNFFAISDWLRPINQRFLFLKARISQKSLYKIFGQTWSNWKGFAYGASTSVGYFCTKKFVSWRELEFFYNKKLLMVEIPLYPVTVK